MRAVRRVIRKADCRKRQGLTPVQSAAKRSGDVNREFKMLGLGVLHYAGAKGDLKMWAVGRALD